MRHVLTGFVCPLFLIGVWGVAVPLAAGQAATAPLPTAPSPVSEAQIKAILADRIDTGRASVVLPLAEF